MHEVGLAEGVLDIALDYAQRNDAKRIAEVTLLIGDMAGVEKDTLEFAFDSIKKGTIANDAKLVMHTAPIVGRCQKCGKEFHIDHYDFFCPECSDGVLELISGRELQVESLEVE